MTRRWAPVAAVIAGVLLGLAAAPTMIWVLALIAPGLLTLLVRGGSARRGLWLGWLFGIGYGAVSISWIHVMGWWIAALLVLVMALWQAMIGALSAVLVRHRAWPLTIAGTWSLAELLSGRFPFGGFGWQRLGYLLVGSPLDGILAWVGVAGASLFVAFVSQLVSSQLLMQFSRNQQRGERVRRLGVGIATVGLVALAVVAPARPLETAGGSVNVGIVQGDVSGTAGSEAMGYARSVTENHVSETVTLMARARAGLDPRPDFVLWPENSTDVDPTLDDQTRELIGRASRMSGLPILVGAAMSGPGPDERQTTALWMSADGTFTSRYDKRNLVPFGEWIPMRKQLLPLVPMLKMVGPQAIPGKGMGLMHVHTGDGASLDLGTVLCFELAWDSTVREAVDGAQIAIAQSNTATYDGTGQPEQQWQITRARAIESGREFVVATTSSLSGMIAADGTVLARTTPRESASMTLTVPRRSGLGLGVRLGPWLELLGSGLALTGMTAHVVARARTRRLERAD